VTRLATLSPTEVIMYGAVLALPPLFGLALLYLALMAQPRLGVPLGVGLLALTTAVATVVSGVVLFDVPPWWLRWALTGLVVVLCVIHAVVVRHRIRAARTHRGEHHP
jgi:hypothetical protein